MAELEAMGEVNEIHAEEEGVVLNGDITKDSDTGDRDIEMDCSDVNMETVTVNKPDIITNSEDVGMNSPNEVETESTNEVMSQSPMDDDSQDSQDSHTSQDAKSQDSQDSQDQDSNMESEPVVEENGSVKDVNEDTNTNSSMPLPDASEANDSSSSSSSRNEDDSRSSAESESTANDQDPLTNASSNENSQESSRKSDQEDSQDGSIMKPVTAENEVSENGTEDIVEEVRPSTPKETPQIEKHEKSELSKETIEVHSDDEGDVLIVDTPKQNGTEVIDLVDTPEKKIPTKAEASTPRRSSRNLNKSKSYADKENPNRPAQMKSEDHESDIEEVVPEDPLALISAVNDQITVERIPMKTKLPEKSAIVVKDTKRLVEIATKSNSNSPSPQPGKKEPTLVIIDTNSILSGRGPVPVPNSKAAISTTNLSSMLPVAVPSAGVYPASMRATITPVPSQSKSMVQNPVAAATTPLLPTLTDDMFVVEAPSFIVPYVYEKPPVKVLKDYIVEVKQEIQENKKKEKEERKTRKEEKLKEKEKKGGDIVESDASYSSEEETDEEEKSTELPPDPKKPYSYFDSPLGKFFTNIGFNLVQEYVQADLLKQQKRKREREQGSNPETNKTIQSLIKTIELSKGNNNHFKMEIKKCEFCNFKTESKLAMAYHLETPHMKNFVYKCNFCPYEVRSPHDILFHMEAEHAVRGHLERAPAFHQCPSCPFEDNQKGKLSRHLVICARKFKPERNLEPPPDWEPPAKIPRLPKMRATGLNATVAAYQSLANKGTQQQQYQFLSKMQLQINPAAQAALNRGRGRPSLGPSPKTQPVVRPQGMIFKQQGGNQVLVPSNFQLSGNQVFQVVGGSELGGRLGGMAFVPSTAQAHGSLQTSSQTSVVPATNTPKKPTNTPSISITPLPRGTGTPPTGSKPGDTSSKNSFVICEICDGYIKDLEQLRNHMQWIHKIKIHPKMIYNRPPLNCQKCQFRFFTDQGLERHLLGSHGLVTSSMQDAANKSKDSGRCPVCGRVYQWKLLNHVARDHNMTLKPAHLSYKCTVCTATFGMYKQFENHVYSAHSVVAKRVMDKKSTSAPASKNSPDVKPLKINDEITIIPQPSKSTNGANKDSSPAPKNSAGTSKSR